MTIEPILLDKLFYLYCALLYNDNKTIRPSTRLLDIKGDLLDIFQKTAAPHTHMPDHRYQYLLTLLNTQNYTPNPETRKDHYDMLGYVQKISEFAEFQNLWAREKTGIRQILDTYKEPIENVQRLFQQRFAFEPAIQNFYVTINWGKSGMSIPTKTGYYIIVGHNFDKPNARNLTHEILHGYLKEVQLQITPTMEKIISNLPESVHGNYRKTYTIVEESVVRALVVYLTNTDPTIPDQKLSKSDLELGLPRMYLETIEKSNPEILTREFLQMLIP